MVLLMPIALIGFCTLDLVKKKIILSICVLSVYEIVMLYLFLILHR